ncbi:MAG: chromosome partition protein MukB [Myxococcales bacterium]|nr:MAG: chromosome partition protein MukB [Myxococcales bacterium]
MSRARATALALVNWKGVFYERYQLDRRVTALEGANGAGKTTVMIAAYIVLLPDMSRLRFTNLGETAAIGGDRGIWGRLGEPTRPSYAALELDLGEGKRVIAGVLLTRKAEPTLELTPFLISELQPGVRLQDLLLLVTAEEEAVPELAELRNSVAAAQARIEVFASAKDYFAAMFELGIGALRLASDEDRGRLGDMLRTSMTGGISRAITAELRSFLLREQGSIGDTLSRMRENLNACRRTRIEVSESQLLEQEISGVYDAGQGMFAAALQATRELARESRQRAARLEEQAARARKTLEEEKRSADALEERENELTEQVKERRTALEELRERARKSASFESLSAILRDVEQERSAASEQVQLARKEQQQTAATRESEKQKREAARLNQERAALGLADLQAGLDELHRRSSAYRRAQKLLTEVESLSPGEPTSAAELPARLEATSARLAAIDAERLGQERTLALAEQRRAEWKAALELCGELGAAGDVPYEAAQSALAELASVEQSLAEKPAMSLRLREHERLRDRQQAARALAQSLGISAPEQVEERLQAAQSEVEDLEAQKRDREEAQRRLAAERQEAAEQLARAQAGVGKYRRLEQRVERISQSAGPFLPTRDALLRLRDSLTSERQELSLASEQATTQREQLLHDANHLEASGGQFSAELLRLRDELDGELLGNRFEELNVKEAARLEALLGPLAQAIVVDDVAAAVELLRDKPRELAEVRLVAAGTDLGFLEAGAEGAGKDACVSEGPALRVTRRPERPSLGRKAREARIEELRREAAALGEELEKRQARLRSVSSALSEVDQLLPDAELLERGDPSQLAAELQARVQQLQTDEQAQTEGARDLAGKAVEARSLVARLRSLLPEAFLLGAEDHAAAVDALGRELSRLEGLAAELAKKQRARRKLAASVEALRVPPPSDEELARLSSAQGELAGERDRVFGLLDLLTQLNRDLPALGWEDAERSLSSREQVAPALEEQHQVARAAVQAAEEAVQLAEQAWEQATGELQQAEAALSAVAAHEARLRSELAGLGISADLTPERAAAELSELTTLAERLSLEERDLLARRGAQAERVRQLGQALGQAQRDLSDAQAAAAPAEARWLSLRAHAERAMVLHSGESSEHDEPRSALQLAAEARSRAALLRDRLDAARGGDALAREVGEQRLEQDDDFLALWLRVREWLARRVPAQVAQVEDPLLALERLRGHLSVLEQRLAHQEADLRGASEDVARGIEVQLRRAKAQVRRLNQNLTGVSFGSIAGIRVEMRRAAQMEPVLRALAEGSAQELLFQSSLPTEEALSEILRRYGGGRSGGGRVLDYREYLELVVEVQRKADGNWEPANPTRLSTGEAIGVGAALMMVVLAEWERDANLLRARRGPGSLRFLFLDEANRLSQDNLGSLFDLCESLDLQLLIAAPEVARADGNTTYRLVRKVTEDGREEVIVSGRRAISSAEPEPPPAAALPSAQQGTLFQN